MLFDLPQNYSPKELQVKQILDFLEITRPTLFRYKKDGLINNFETEHILNFAVKNKDKFKALKDLSFKQITYKLNETFFHQTQIESKITKQELDLNFVAESIALLPVYIRKHAKLNNISKNELEVLLILRRFKIFDKQLINSIYPSAMKHTQTLITANLIKPIDSNGETYMTSKLAETIAQNLLNDIIDREPNIFLSNINPKKKLINLLSNT